MGEIIKLQCDICGKTWDPRERSQFAVLHVYSPAVAPDKKGVMRETVKEEKFYICDDCLQKYFSPLKAKKKAEEAKKEEQSSKGK